MLEDTSFSDVVSWGPQGDCFVVKDMNEFTKSILPRMFKHSNFASFVRQLNKYDFHKVKNTDDNQFGEHVRICPFFCPFSCPLASAVLSGKKKNSDYDIDFCIAELDFSAPRLPRRQA